MNKIDEKIVQEGLAELFGVTGPKYRAAAYAEYEAHKVRRLAEEEVQERFRPQWRKITGIIRRELRRRGIRGSLDHRGYGGNDCVFFGPSKSNPGHKEANTVGIGHIEYDTTPSIHVYIWIGHGVELKWSGWAKDGAHFARKFDVLLGMLDGYLLAAKLAGGRDCATCDLHPVKEKDKCERCRTCRDGSMWL